MEHLLSIWPKIAERLSDARHLLLLSDYDGTLTPIVEKPEMAIITESTRRLLSALTRQSHVTVGIVSGRELDDIKSKINISGIIYAGNHGFEIEGPDWNFINPIAKEIRPFIQIIQKNLNLALEPLKGAWVEDKKITLSVHYREVEESRAKEIHYIVDGITNSSVSSGLIKVTSGKRVYEIRPAIAWDKGKAIRLLMKRYGKGGRKSGLLPVYLGDDLTDEDGFRIIERYGEGITVLVGEVKRKSAAQYFLNSPDEVNLFLDKLLEHWQRELQCKQQSTS